MKTIIPSVARMGALALALLVSCAAPQPVARLEPILQKGTATWSHGNQRITLPEQNGLQLSTAYRASDPHHLMLEFHIQNRSNKAVLVTPEQFFYEALAADTTTILATSYANDPEKELLQMELTESRLRAEQQNETTSELFAIAIDIADDITDRNETQAERNLEWTEQEARHAEYESSQANYEINFRSMNEKRDYWANRTIRRTTVEPGYELAGSVFFPRNNEARFIRVHFVIDNQTFTATFKQVLHRP